MRNLIILIGLPYSGKTTWALTQGHPVVSPDAIRLAVHGKRFEATKEPLVWGIAHTMLDALFEAGHETVILDACNTTAKRRAEWKGCAWVRFHYLDTPVGECVRRAHEAGDDAILHVIHRMHDQFQAVTQEEIAEFEDAANAL